MGDHSVTNEQLYNCCTNCQPPDWSLFDAIEVHPMVTVGTDYEGTTHVEPADRGQKPEFWTVFGHFAPASGQYGCEAITDVPKEADARIIAKRFQLLVANEFQLLSDQPPTCPKCGARTEWEEEVVQFHTCLGCKHQFMAVDR